MPPDELNKHQIEDGNTPLTGDETGGLIPPHLTTRADLNQWEIRNIERAMGWIGGRTLNVLDQAILQELHRRMFDETWKWAGEFRDSDKSISAYHWTEVPRLVRDLLANTQAQYEHGAKIPKALDELAIRFHHEFVRIHPWPNGNGRHSRLATDLLLQSWERPPFSWGNAAHPTKSGEVRARYIAALRAADAGSFDELRRFARA
ncbi:MAG: mobile mystery protein B [Gemmatimonadetes bacterium]|nr:mobile mystery protein B [Gemmatimonadota bacterium]